MCPEFYDDCMLESEWCECILFETVSDQKQALAPTCRQLRLNEDGGLQ